jgi:electron transfer flavoprotein alpha subunit
MTVLCLVEQDADGASDASLRALAFAASLAGVGLAGPGMAGAVAGPGAAGAVAGPGAAGAVAGPGAAGAVAGLGAAGAVAGPGMAGPGAAGEGQAGRAPVAAVLFGPADQVPGATLAACGAASAYVVEPGDLHGYAPRAWARALAGLAEQAGAAAVVAAATDRGNEVMAYLGALTGQPMAANCVQAEPGGDGSYQVVRHRWAGLLLEEARLDGSPALMTVATEAVPAAAVADPGAAGPGAAGPGAAGPGAAGPALPVHGYAPGLDEDDLLVRATETAGHTSGASLATARVVVGGGRGVGGPDGFAPLEELASLLGGVVGVSRVVTSEGWRPHRQQVGQTGTKITPELYLACGISGAIQHMAGCAGAKHIVVVNTDPGAPILSHADYAVIGDLGEVIPALVAALRDRSAPG